MRLRGLVKLEKRDLDDLQVQLGDLAEFAFGSGPDQRDKLAGQTFGHTDLERHPLVFSGESTYLLLPTAVGSAITRLVIEFVTSIEQIDTFERVLALEFAEVFRDAPLLGPGMPVPFQRIEGGRVGAVMKEVDPGRFLQLVFFTDGLDDFVAGGLCGVSPASDALAASLKILIQRAAERVG